MTEEHITEPSRQGSSAFVTGMLRILCIAATAGFIFYVIFLFFRPVELEDVWWHLATGKWIGLHRSVPTFDIFAFAEPASGISPQWLGSYTLFLIYQMFDLTGLKVFRVVIVAAVLLLFVRRYARDLPAVIWLTLLYLLTFALSLRALLRPFLFNFIFVQLILAHLLDARRQTSYLPYFKVLVLGVVWYNLHMGAVVYGLALIGVFWLNQVVSCLQPGDEDPGLARRHLGFLTITAVLYGAISFVTPYGIEGGAYPYRALFDKEFIHFSQLQGFIAELQPPVMLLRQGAVWIYALIAAALWCVFRSREDQLLRMLLLAVGIFFFLTGIRGVVFAMLICLYVIGEWGREQDWREHWRRQPSAVLEGGLWILLGVSFLNALPGVMLTHVVQRGERIANSSLPVSVAVPEEMIAFLEAEKITGRVINSSAYGGYLLWRLYPAIKPLADNRQYDWNQYGLYRELLRNPVETLPQIEATWPLAAALMDASHQASRRLIEHLRHHPGWQLVWVKGDALVFVPTDHVGRLSTEVREWIEHLDEDLEYGELTGELARHMHHSGSPHYTRWSPPPYYIESLQEGISLLELGYHAAALPRLKQGVEFLDQEATSNLFHAIQAGDEER